MMTRADRHSRRAVLAGIGAGALASAGAHAQVAAPSPAPSAADLRGDVAILREALTLHPGLYRYTTPRAMAARLDAFTPAFVSAPDQAGRYLALARLLASIRCGHSYANFYNQKQALKDALFDRPTRLPFRFLWIGDQMVVTADDSGTGQLPPGSLITDINGVAPRAMLTRLLPYVRADGHNDGKRKSLLSVQVEDSIETFDVFHGLVFGPPPGGVHHIAATAPDGRRITAALPVLSWAARRATQPPQPGKNAPLWTWEMRRDGIALLTMPSWAVYDTSWAWENWLAERLSSLGGARGLIIDLRANEGGNDCGDTVLARLAAHDLRTTGYEQRLRFQRTPARIDRYLDTWDDSFRTLGVGAQPLPGGFFARPNAQAIATIPAIGPRLTLPVATLVGPVNSSATFQFALNARTHGLSRLFGAPTGGNLRGINGGAFFFVRLPASGLEFDLPLIGYFAQGNVADAGLAPDIAVPVTAADIAQGRDRAMARATEWITRA